MQDPREQSMCSFFKETCFPYMRVYSFIFVITMTEVCVFIGMLLYGGIDYQGEFLQVNRIALDKFGGKWPYKMRYRGEI